MNIAMLATYHISGAGIAGVLAGLAVAAVLTLYLVVDPRRHR